MKSLLFAMLLGAPLTASAQDVEINETNFPDENFRNWLLAQDYGEDGVITAEEIEGITKIDVSWREISSLKGIEHFTALEFLSCDKNQLTALDVSNNTALTILYCHTNQLVALDVSNNTALRDLDCSNNQLTALDVSKNTALTNLYCYSNQLTALDVSKNTALTELSCSSNQLTALDVSKNTALTELSCSSNQLTTLDVSNNTALIFLDCSNNQFTALDVSNNTALIFLDCSYNQLTALYVSNNTTLRELDCSTNQIKGAMDALINSLPTPGGWLKVYDNRARDEGNVCTKTQVAAAKAKGWIPFYYDSTIRNWVEYEGSDEETGIVRPATATTNANEPVYTLSGQKVSNGSLKGKKGVYIIGGKKVVVK